MTDELCKKIYEHAMKVAIRIVHDRNDAGEVAQSVVYKALISEESLEEPTLMNWVSKVAKHDAVDILRRKNKFLNFDNMEYLVTQSLIKPIKDKKEIEQEDKIIQEQIDQLPGYERQLLTEYYKRGRKIKNLIVQSKYSQAAIKKKIYRNKRDVRAKFYKENGMIGSKKIVGAKLHENILNFIKKFKRCLKTGKVDSMRIYFGTKDLAGKFPKFEIRKFIDYDINLSETNTYHLSVSFEDREGKFDCFRVIFEVYQENRIRIIDLPKPPKEIHCYDLKDVPGEVLAQLHADKTGIIPVSKEKVKALLKDIPEQDDDDLEQDDDL